MQLHIIFTETTVLLSKKSYPSWRDVQDDYDGYKTSLGPWSVEGTIDWLATEYNNLEPSPEEQINRFIISDDQTVQVEFRKA